MHSYTLGLLSGLEGARCGPPFPQGVTLRLQCSQKWLHTAGCGFSHALHSFLCCITHRSDVGVALLSGGISCRNHVTGRADKGQASHLIYCILKGESSHEACKHDTEHATTQCCTRISTCLFKSPGLRKARQALLRHLL